MSQLFIKLFVLSICLISITDCCLTKKFEEIQRKLEEIKNRPPTTKKPKTLPEEPHDFVIIQKIKAVLNASSELSSNSTETMDSSELTAMEDELVRSEWGDECTSAHWDYCSRVHAWGGTYFVLDKEDPEKKKTIPRFHQIDCTLKEEREETDKKEEMRVVCLKNGWTVNRCTLLCMSQCNKAIMIEWNDYVSYLGPCVID